MVTKKNKPKKPADVPRSKSEVGSLEEREPGHGLRGNQELIDGTKQLINEAEAKILSIRAASSGIEHPQSVRIHFSMTDIGEASVEITWPLGDRTKVGTESFGSVAGLRALTKFESLWSNHPYPNSPCDTTLFPNQCAIRMGVALEKSNVDTSGFDRMYPGRRCWMNHSPHHILAAEELAKWLDKSQVLGSTSKESSVTSNDYSGKTGVVFFLNMHQSGDDTIDHIDLWKNTALKAGTLDYFESAEQVWFWDVS